MERNITTLGIVLHSQRWGQIHRRLRLLSVDLGIIHVINYGAQKSQKAIKAEVFVDGQFFLYHNPVKGDYTLKDLHLIADHRELRDDLAATYTGLFFNELLSNTAYGEGASVYTLLSTALDLLVFHPERREYILIQFVHQLSRIIGVQVDLSACPLCQRPYGEQEVIYFSSTLGSQCCEGCAALERTLILPPGARRYLTVTATMAFADAVMVELNPPALQRIKQYMVRFAQYISPKALSSVASGLL